MVIVLDASEKKALLNNVFKLTDKKTRKQVRKGMGLKIERDELKTLLIDIMRIQEDIYLDKPYETIILSDLSKRLNSIWEEWFNGEKVLDDKRDN